MQHVAAVAPYRSESARKVLPINRATLPRNERTRTDPIGSWAVGAPHTSYGGARSAPYMSPGQWGDPCAVDPATDVYSLGCDARLIHIRHHGRLPALLHTEQRALDPITRRSEPSGDVPAGGTRRVGGVRRVPVCALAKRALT